MNQAAMTLWQAIDALAAQVPFSKEKVESAIPTRLRDTEAPGSEVFRFFDGTPVQLGDGVEVSQIDLRIKREGSHPGFLVLNLTGHCVSLDEVRQRYKNLQIFGVPTGRSLDEATSYSTALGWGQLSFGFRERNPACLGYVVFDPA